MLSDNQSDRNQPSRKVFGIAPRKDDTVEDGEWKWEPAMSLTIQKDAALAATNALSTIWDGHYIVGRYVPHTCQLALVR